MKKTKTPAPQRAGTQTNNRPAREAAVLAKLERLEKRDPSRFAEAIQFLAELLVANRPETK